MAQAGESASKPAPDMGLDNLNASSRPEGAVW
jgi:hypothetical protein